MPLGTKRGILSADTSFDVEERQIRIWREMSTVERLALVNEASRAARTLALAGLEERYPNASHGELIARFGRLTLGETLARKAYPELEHPSQDRRLGEESPGTADALDRPAGRPQGR